MPGHRPRYPLPGTRRALIERGDADISYGLQPKDFKDLAEAGKVKVAAVPVPNAIWYVTLNSALPPFSTTLLFDAGCGTIAEPMAVLVKKALAPLGIRVELSKIPGANFRGKLNKKTAPMVINRFGGWLDWPDYFFFWNYHGNNSIFDIPSYQNPAMDRLIDGARFAPDAASYAQNVRGFLELGMQEVPFIAIAQPFHDVAMQRTIGGYQFWPCREPDFRTLTKG